MINDFLRESILEFAQILKDEQELDIKIEDCMERSRYSITFNSEQISLIFSILWQDASTVHISIPVELNIPIKYDPPAVITSLLPFMYENGTKIYNVWLEEKVEDDHPAYNLQMEVGFGIVTALCSVAVIEETFLRLINIVKEIQPHFDEMVEDAEYLERNMPEPEVAENIS